ncbi:MAG: hypothetical protein MUC41_06060 [Syntrophobacteraceae bacterium]|jgi:hypothetical protein|nr:hypothetical protein [Syntrophobacteraceae bacterium]
MFNKSDGIPEDHEPGAETPGRKEASLSDGWDMGGPLGFDAGPESQSGGMSFDFEGFEKPSSSLTLDDFEGEPEPSSSGSSPEAVMRPDGLADESPSFKAGELNKGKRRKKLILAISVAACIGIAAAIAVPAYKAMKPKRPALLGKTNIRHSLIVPEFQDEFAFLVLATSEKDKNLINIRLSFVFSASNAFEQFSEHATIYREAVYQYLLRARPAKNSQKLWQGILEKQLTEYLKQVFPGSGIQTIRVAHWERL